MMYHVAVAHNAIAHKAQHARRRSYRVLLYCTVVPPYLFQMHARLYYCISTTCANQNQNQPLRWQYRFECKIVRTTPTNNRHYCAAEIRWGSWVDNHIQHRYSAVAINRAS